MALPGLSKACRTYPWQPRRLEWSVLEKSLQECRHAWGALGGWRRRPGLAPAGELEDVVRASHLRAGTDRRGLPAAEGLAADHGAGDGAVDVEVARLDPVTPAGDLAVVQALDPARESVGRPVGEDNRLLQMLGAHEPEHRAETFRDVEERPAADA